MFNFIDELKSLNIYEQLTQRVDGNPQANYDIFSHLLNYAKDKHLPKKVVRYNKKIHKKSKWITRGIMKSINTKDKLYKTLAKTDLHSPLYNTLKSDFKAFQKSLKKTINAAKKSYFHKIFHLYRNNIKKTWAVINETLFNKQHSEISQTFQLNNRLTTDPAIIADEFNKYFVNIGPSLYNEIHSTRSYSDYLIDKTSHRFKFDPVNEDHISSIINKLKPKSSTGHDNISNKLIKSAKHILIKPLVLIINQSLNRGIFPSQLKLSKVKPLFKKNDKTQFSNYRPISLLPSISKIFEYVIFNQVSSYLNNHNLLTSHQFGFRAGHSTELAALKLVNYLIAEMNNGQCPINIYMDLSKAFDTLDHSILLKKLEYYGICGLENKLLCNYLSNRHQYVEYNRTSSSTRSISTGVPQGSILGPLLFLIYINDLPKASTLFDMLMYADDTTLYCNINTLINESIINDELDKIKIWLSANKLSLNIGKTKYVIYHSINKQIIYPNLKISNIEIERVQQFNYLGLLLDNHLQWKLHIDHISSKISKVTGIMYKLYC